ncbi:MAG: VOC family protein [Chloroflexi bacterium]|uniref:VOC family protein n=1 Tax=Candidatus Flexifilum breve TaxID=3140694 RepID=UPI00313670E5|nr:VOC family protein [Chloroflexota bacterium]
MQMKLELVPVPVRDLERAKAFYADVLGFHVDHDTTISAEVRLIQLTPPGSACSIVISQGIPNLDEMTPGTIKALHLVVKDVSAARAEYRAKGIDVGEITDHGRGVKSAGFSDPDGNSWLFQEMAWRSAEFEGT